MVEERKFDYLIELAREQWQSFVVMRSRGPHQSEANSKKLYKQFKFNLDLVYTSGESGDR